MSASQLSTVPWSALVIIETYTFWATAPVFTYEHCRKLHCSMYIGSQSFTSILDELPSVPTRSSIKWTTVFVVEVPLSWTTSSSEQTIVDWPTEVATWYSYAT